MPRSPRCFKNLSGSVPVPRRWSGENSIQIHWSPRLSVACAPRNTCSSWPCTSIFNQSSVVMLREDMNSSRAKARTSLASTFGSRCDLLSRLCTVVFAAIENRTAGFITERYLERLDVVDSCAFYAGLQKTKTKRVGLKCQDTTARANVRRHFYCVKANVGPNISNDHTRLDKFLQCR